MVTYYVRLVEEDHVHVYDLKDAKLIDTGSEHNYGESEVENSWGLVIDRLSL